VQSKYSRKTDKIGGFVLSAVFISAIAGGLFLYQSSRSANEEAPRVASGDADAGGRTTGSILMRGGADGACRQMKFDNATGRLKQDIDTACDNKAPGTNSTEGRMNAIRDAFSKK
jgi:hypothetical protein